MSTTTKNNEDIDQLLKLASEQPSPEQSQEKLSEVQQWIAAIGIKGGEHIIDTSHLYWEYKKWAAKPIPFLTFSKQMKKAMKVHRGACPSGQKPYYLVDPAQFDITLDNFWERMAEVRLMRNERRRKSLERKKKLEGGT